MAEAKKTKENKETKKKRKSPEWVDELRYGQSISLEFFKTNAWLILVIVVVIVALMGLRYKTKTRMEEIKSLTTELQRSRSVMLNEKSDYMSLIRETEMKRMVHERGLPLEFQEQPPYRLSETYNQSQTER